MAVRPVKQLTNQLLNGDSLELFCSQCAPSKGVTVTDEIDAGSRQFAFTLIPSGLERGT